jgi:hypothetical protein
VLLLMWCAWHIRNDMIFGTGKETVMGLGNFLVSYSETLSGIKKQAKFGWSDKGKTAADGDVRKEEDGSWQRTEDTCMREVEAIAGRLG